MRDVQPKVWRLDAGGGDVLVVTSLLWSSPLFLLPTQLRVKTHVRPSGHGGGGAMRHDPVGFIISECSHLSVAVACSKWYDNPIDPTSNLVTHSIACTYLVHATKSSFHHLFPWVPWLGRGSSLTAVGWCRCDEVRCFLQGGVWLNVVIDRSWLSLQVVQPLMCFLSAACWRRLIGHFRWLLACLAWAMLSLIVTIQPSGRSPFCDKMIL